MTGRSCSELSCYIINIISLYSVLKIRYGTNPLAAGVLAVE